MKSRMLKVAEFMIKEINSKYLMNHKVVEDVINIINLSLGGKEMQECEIPKDVQKLKGNIRG